MKSAKLREFIKEIQYHNRNPKDNSVLNMLDDLSTNPEQVLNGGAELYRSRLIADDDKVGKQSDFFGFDADGSFIPPVSKTKDMRANYAISHIFMLVRQVYFRCRD
jgi:hypothetical protein